jgi:hypothetical protein
MTSSPTCGPRAGIPLLVISDGAPGPIAAGPPAIGLLAESAGLLHALWLIAALFLAAFAAAGSLRRRNGAQDAS